MQYLFKKTILGYLMQTKQIKERPLVDYFTNLQDTQKSLLLHLLSSSLQATYSFCVKYVAFTPCRGI